MNTRQLAGIAAAITLAAVGAVALKGVDTADVKPITDALKPLDEQREKALEPSKLAVLEDGGLAYAVDARIADGGVELRRVSPGCVRRPVGVRPTDCQRATFDLGGKPVVVDPGELNRFPVAEAVGARCQPVACSVYAGEDADADETGRVRERKGGAR